MRTLRVTLLQFAMAYVRKLRLFVGRLKQFPFSGEVVPETGREELREVLPLILPTALTISEGESVNLSVSGPPIAIEPTPV